MAKRYTTQSRWSDQLDCETIDIGNAYTVHEREDAPQFTGLVDANGNRIMRVESIDPIGFITKGNTNG